MSSSAALSRLSRSPGGGPAARELRRWAVGADDAARVAGVGVVGVCVLEGKGPSWLPRCSAPPPIRGPGPARQHSGEPGRYWSVQDLSKSSPVTSASQSLHCPRLGLSGSSDHAASEREKIQIGDDNVTGFETTTGGLCIQSEPCQRRRTGDESPEETCERKHPAPVPCFPSSSSLRVCLSASRNYWRSWGDKTCLQCILRCA